MSRDTCKIYKSSNPFHSTFFKLGSFDQYDMKFSARSKGNQCTCNCLMYLALSFQYCNQNFLDMDHILNMGDILYKKTVDKLKN